MARLARVVVPGTAHHVTQRGNGRACTFFSNQDYALYRDLLAEHCRRADVEIWAWCLMPNHVHLVLVPSDRDGLRRALAAVHRRYAGVIHARRRRTGHFWQGRFGAVAMDEDHLMAALRYVSLNPVRARLTGKDDGITARAPIPERVPDFADLSRWRTPQRSHACAQPRASAGPSVTIGSWPRSSGPRSAASSREGVDRNRRARRLSAI